MEREEKQSELTRPGAGDARAASGEDMRDIVRRAFMSHPAATEEDFERCWPALRDEMLKRHALDAYDAWLGREGRGE